MSRWYRMATYPRHYPFPPDGGDPISCPDCAASHEKPWNNGSVTISYRVHDVRGGARCTWCGAIKPHETTTTTMREVMEGVAPAVLQAVADDPRVADSPLVAALLEALYPEPPSTPTTEETDRDE